MNPLRDESTPLVRALKTQSLPRCLPAGSQALHTQTTATSMSDISWRRPMLALKSRHCHENEWGATLEWREWGTDGDYHLGVGKSQRCAWAIWRCVMWVINEMLALCHGRFGGECMHVHLCMWKWARMCHSMHAEVRGPQRSVLAFHPVCHWGLFVAFPLCEPGAGPWASPGLLLSLPHVSQEEHGCLCYLVQLLTRIWRAELRSSPLPGKHIYTELALQPLY